MNKPKSPPRSAEPVESLGEVWYLSEITPALRRRYAAPVRARARQALLDDKPAMDEDTYATEWEAFQARIDSGAYEWGPPLELGGTGPGKAILAALGSTDGQVRLLQLLLEQSHGDVDTKRAIEILEGNPDGIAAAIRAVMGLPAVPTAPPEPTKEPGEKDEKKTGETTTATAAPAA